MLLETDDEKKVQKIKEEFERQGFVVGNGLKYGVDLILYTDEKDKVHSKYAVLLNRGQSFHQLISIQRICASVKKEFVLVDFRDDGDFIMHKFDRFYNPQTGSFL
ncbi:hypothetical protein EDEG_02809 [Edhazardia aedis USNM 41457]|uniref:tRNA-intron lyase n=1 Tax=Edhazardia aedis (strain USNM 41457) TaxID=1003232 RepID=J8ZSZ8_EDHAE|nr:hypothetical protein EDEG_02809 [Edhazardia aedis USNM 41457]|eukprot:EJW02793.1 hypothetical protein EDEG_02809 [Edhazardia aedis USNM 41457]